MALWDDYLDELFSEPESSDSNFQDLIDRLEERGIEINLHHGKSLGGPMASNLAYDSMMENLTLRSIPEITKYFDEPGRKNKAFLAELLARTIIDSHKLELLDYEQLEDLEEDLYFLIAELLFERGTDITEVQDQLSIDAIIQNNEDTRILNEFLQVVSRLIEEYNTLENKPLHAREIIMGNLNYAISNAKALSPNTESKIAPIVEKIQGIVDRIPQNKMLVRSHIKYILKLLSEAWTYDAQTLDPIINEPAIKELENYVDDLVQE